MQRDLSPKATTAVVAFVSVYKMEMLQRLAKELTMRDGRTIYLSLPIFVFLFSKLFWWAPAVEVFLYKARYASLWANPDRTSYWVGAWNRSRYRGTQRCSCCTQYAST